MGVAFVFAGAVFVGESVLERAIRWIFMLSGLVIIAALPALVILFGADLEYRFEVTALAIYWTVLIVTGVLLSVFFNRSRKARYCRVSELTRATDGVTAAGAVRQ
jgi:hypothetical protein